MSEICPRGGLRPELDPPTARIARLRIDERGYPVPWFVAWVDGKPDHRVADGFKWNRAVRLRLCWTCGEPLGVHLTFAIGPMCGVNRTTAEPPSHLECARWSVRNCPFLSRPHAVRRQGGIPEDASSAGEPIKRNPGVTLLWNTRGYRLFPDGKGRALFRIGDPESIEWWSERRQATLAEIEHSVDTGLPFLREMAEAEGTEAMTELDRCISRFRALYPAA